MAASPPRETCLAPLRFDSSTLPEGEQYQVYASSMANFDVSRPGTGPFSARSLVWNVGKLVIAQVESDPIRLERSSARVCGDRVDHIYVNYYYRGRFTFDCEAGLRRGSPGSLVVIDMRQSCRLDLERNEDISIGIPRSLLLDKLDGIDPHGMVVRGGIASLLGAMLRTLCGMLSRTASAHAAGIEQMVIDLVVSTITDALRTAEARRAREEALASRARAYIDRNIGEALDVDSICAALAVSRSNLYRAFGDAGGVQHQIRARRLRRICVLLADPAETRSIASLAVVCGFADRSHLTRAFKRAYGMTPGAFRQTFSKARAPGTASDNDAAHRFRNWVRELS